MDQVEAETPKSGVFAFFLLYMSPFCEGLCAISFYVFV